MLSQHEEDPSHHQLSRNYDQSESSGEEVSADEASQSTGNRAKKILSVGGLFAVLAVAVFGTVHHTQKSAHPADFAKTAKMSNTEQLTELVKDQVRALKIHPDAESHVDSAIDKVRSFLKEHMPAKQLQAIEDARLSKQDWQDLRDIAASLHDNRVQHVGSVVLEEARKNLLLGPAQIGNHVVSELQESKLRALLREVVPPNVQKKLARRFGRDVKRHPTRVTQEEVWTKSLDPTGEVFQYIRNGTSSKNGAVLVKGDDWSLQVDNAKAVDSRRLRTGDWSAPKLNVGELTTGILAVSFIGLSELMLHLDLFIPNFEIPVWGHAIMFVPGVSLGTASCIIGLSFWCDFWLGSLGLNAMEAFAIGVFIMGRLDSPMQPLPAVCNTASWADVAEHCGDCIVLVEEMKEGSNYQTCNNYCSQQQGSLACVSAFEEKSDSCEADLNQVYDCSTDFSAFTNDALCECFPGPASTR